MKQCGSWEVSTARIIHISRGARDSYFLGNYDTEKMQVWNGK